MRETRDPVGVGETCEPWERLVDGLPPLPKPRAEEGPAYAGPSSLSDQLRAAIRNSGVALAQIQYGIGIPAPSVRAFLAGRRGMTLTTAERLADWLGVEFVLKETE